jgi:glycosyltransferase involved in cell wall biosynthesis
MKILHVINSMIVGGAETLLKDAIIGINEKIPEYEQHLITLYGGGKMLDPIKNIIKYKDLNVNHFNFLFKSLELRQYIKANKIDVVHAHLYDAMILTRLAIPKNVKILYTYHSGLHNPKSNDYSFLRNKLDRLTYNKNHTAIYVSDTVKNEVICGIDIKGPSYVIYNFTSTKFTQQFKYNNDNKLKLISVGNLRIAKNHKYAIEIFAELKEYPITLDIYGSGFLKEELDALIQLTGSNVNIITDAMLTSEILAKYDLFFMSSFQEGMSVALIEAMTTGLPSLLSDIDSFKETAEESALYFDLNNMDDPKSKLLYILKNKVQLKNMSLMASELSEKYSLDQYIQRTTSLYIK